jgi:OmpA-OmpF porin, OOP family
MDSKKLICFALLVTTAGVCHADGFFVNTSLGETNFYPQQPIPEPYFYGHSHTEALRFGYRWHTGPFSYGLETGYVNLGHHYSNYGHLTGFDNFTDRVDGFVLGPTLKYALPMGFYISAHGGLFRSTDHDKDTYTSWGFFSPQYSETSRLNFSGTGNYVGLGLGYDFNQSLGVSLNYDRYRPHSPAEIEVNSYQYSLFTPIPRVDAYTVTAEYRF